MAASVGVLKNSILLGQVIPSTLTKAVKVQVPYFVYDDIIGAYFKKTKDFVAEDSLKVKEALDLQSTLHIHRVFKSHKIAFQDCKTGDLVVITKLVKLEKKEITHTVTERVFR